MTRFLALIALLWSGLALAQPAPTPGTAALVCAYNSSIPAPTSGTFAYVQCDSTGKLITSGGGGLPGGSNTQVQYNNSGAFGGISGVTTDGNVLSITAPAGSTGLTLVGGTQTSSFPVLNATQRWNAIGTTFTAWKLNVTDTNSAPLSLLQDWQVDGTSKAGVIKSGEIYSNAGFFYSAAKSFTSGAPTGIYFNSSVSATLMADNLQYMNWTNFNNDGRLITIHQSAAIGFSTNTNILSGSDASFSRISSGIIGVGNNGRAGNIAGGLQANSYALRPGTAIPAGGTAGFGFTATSATNFGVFFGSGTPSLAAAKGSLYLRSDGSGIADRAYINTDGSTTWAAIATAS